MRKKVLIFLRFIGEKVTSSNFIAFILLIIFATLIGFIVRDYNIPILLSAYIMILGGCIMSFTICILLSIIGAMAGEKLNKETGA